MSRRLDPEMTNGAGNELPVTVLGNQHVNGFLMVPTIRHHQKPTVPNADNEWLAFVPKSFWDVTADNLPPARMEDQTNVQRRQPTEYPDDGFRLKDSLQWPHAIRAPCFVFRLPPLGRSQ